MVTWINDDIVNIIGYIRRNWGSKGRYVLDGLSYNALNPEAIEGFSGALIRFNVERKGIEPFSISVEEGLQLLLKHSNGVVPLSDLSAIPLRGKFNRRLELKPEDTAEIRDCTYLGKDGLEADLTLRKFFEIGSPPRIAVGNQTVYGIPFA